MGTIPQLTFVSATFVTLVASVPNAWQARESAGCQSNIVSSTVVATFCGHREDDNEMLDLLILWRGTPGWFQRGSRGGGGSGVFGGGRAGQVSRHETYGDVTIAFDADFDLRIATIVQSTVKLDGVNTVLIDEVDRNRRMSATAWIAPRLPLVGDWNVTLVRRSRQLRRFLRCDVPMPAAPPGILHPPVVTVCEKLKRRTIP